MAPEKYVGYDGDAGFRGIVCGRIEARAERWLHAEQREDVRGSARPVDPFRFRTVRQVEVRVFKSSDRLELRRQPLPLEKIRVSRGHSLANGTAERRIFFPDHHDPFRIAQRKGTKQDGVNDAEDGRVRADAEGEDCDRRERKPRRLSQHAKTKPEVGQEIPHRVQLDIYSTTNPEPLVGIPQLRDCAVRIEIMVGVASLADAAARRPYLLYRGRGRSVCSSPSSSENNGAAPGKLLRCRAICRASQRGRADTSSGSVESSSRLSGRALRRRRCRVAKQTSRSSGHEFFPYRPG